MKIGQKNAASTGTSPCIAAGAPSMGVAGAHRRLDVARLMRPLVGKVDDVAPSPARAAHLVLLRNAVATGRYQPDLHEVARKLLLEAAAGQAR